MKTIDIYYVGDEDCLPYCKEDAEAYMDTECTSKSFRYTKELEEILEQFGQELPERTPNILNLEPDDVLSLIEYCANQLKTPTDLWEEPLTDEKESAYRALLSFFGSECDLEVASYFFVIKNNKK